MRVRSFVSVFVLAAFALFEWSCAAPSKGRRIEKTVKQDIAKVDTKDPSLKIVTIVTKEGRQITFPEGQPGHFNAAGDAVVGTALQQLTFRKEGVQITYKGQGAKRRIDSILDAEGRVYPVLSSIDQGESVVVNAYAPLSVPVPELQQVWIGKTDKGGMATMAVLGIVAGAAVVVVIAAGVSGIGGIFDFDSCPFVYSWDGTQYVLDAEPYGAAITEGLKRTEWIELSELKAENGRYRVRLANELDETQYTDELKLVAVDHAPGVKIAPDLAGRFHALPAPRPPVRAFDQNGRDVLRFVAENDRVFWLSPTEEKDPEGAGEFRDELVVEFPKPAGAKRATLLANVWTTQWGSYSSKLFLGHYGTALEETYREVDARGPMYARLARWMATEELALLKVWVETPGGWTARAMIMGGATAIAKDKAYEFDVSDVPGEVLRIKLRPPVNFWMINALAVDYDETASSPTAKTELRVTELAAERAVDQDGRDVRALLAATDGLYLEDPNPGERTDLVFPAPPPSPGLERSVFVKASGYYRVHVDQNGEPRRELAERVLGEPGFAARYSFREYLEWVSALNESGAGSAVCRKRL